MCTRRRIPEPNNPVLIAVVGGRDCSPEEAELAEEVGREIARRGAVLICGGLTGVMEAACRGAWEEGGITIGVLPGERREEANPYVRIPIVTGLGEARNVIIVKSAHAVIAINGEYGTLSEIAYALKAGIPVVGLRTWKIEGGRIASDPIIRASGSREAVEKAFRAIRGDEDLSG